MKIADIAEDQSQKPVQVIVSGIDSITNNSLKMKEEKSKELEENPDYVLVSKKAFEAEMNNKDEQINILMSSVNNLQNQVALLQR